MTEIDREVIERARWQSRNDRQLLRDLVKIRRSKEKFGLTQSVVAKRMATNQASVSRLESGQVDVRRRTLRHYATAIGVRIDYAVTDLDPVYEKSVVTQDNSHGE